MLHCMQLQLDSQPGIPSHHHLSAHGSVGQHTDQLDSKEKKAEVWFACQQHFQFVLGHMLLSVTAAVTLLLM